MAVETILNLPVKNNFKIIPVKAKIQTMEKISQPVSPFKLTSVKGV
jgi:hypothetical protein